MAVAVRDRTNPINSTAMRLEPLGTRSPLLDLSDAAVKVLTCGATDWAGPTGIVQQFGF